MKKVQKDKGNDVLNNMKSQFARETNQRDEDAEMQKFIEEQLKLKRGDLNKDATKSSVDQNGEKRIKKPDEALFDVPKYLIENKSKHKSEETLSEQMLSGIPEVDLGVEERIRNIEETERAKQMILLKDNKKTEIQQHSSSINFVQHKRFEEHNQFKQKHAKEKIQKAETPAPVVGDTEKHGLLQKGILL